MENIPSASMPAFVPREEETQNLPREFLGAESLLPGDWFHGGTDTGRAREANEDKYLCDPQRKLFIVADGMGGHAAGEEASRIAIEELSSALTLGVLLHSPDEESLTDQLVEALKTANDEVMRHGESNVAWHGMGTTAVVAVLKHHILYMANIGDSRAYLLRGDVLRQLSRDHSVAAALVAQEHITPEEVRFHPMRNRLTGCLGIDAEIHPDTCCTPVELGDVVLLCSDGLWDMLSDQDIASHLNHHRTPQEAVELLIEAANEAGGKDNITAVVLHLRQDVLGADTSGFGELKPLEIETASASDDEDTVVIL